MPRRRDPPDSHSEARDDPGRVLPNRKKLRDLRESKRRELGAKNSTAVKAKFLDWIRSTTFTEVSEESESGRGIWDNAFGREPRKMYRASLGKLAAFFGRSVEELIDAQDAAPPEVARPPAEQARPARAALDLAQALERWRHQVKTHPKWQPVRLLLSSPVTGGQELYQELSVVRVDLRMSALSTAPLAVAEYTRSRSAEEALSAFSLRALLTLNQRRSVLMGIPGSGKTAASKWILHLVEAGLVSDYRYALLVSLREYALALRGQPSLGILAHFFTQAAGASLEEGEALAAEVSSQREREQGPAPLVVLDGWDEVPADMKDHVVAAMERELTAFRVLITSRPSGGARVLDTGDTGFYELYPLTAPAVRRFVQRFCHIRGRREAVPRLLEEITRDPGLQQLALTPFLLMIVCEVLLVHERLPAETPLTQTWVMSQLLALARQDHSDRYPGMSLDAAAIEKLSAFAYALSLASGAKRIAGFAPASIRDDQNVRASRFLSEVSSEPGTFEFAHLRLQEFLAALTLRDMPDEAQGRFIQERGLTAQWAEETAFLAGLCREKSPESEPWRSMRGHLSVASEELTGSAWHRVGRVVSAAALSEGGTRQLGVDVRERLLRLFLEGRPLADDLMSTLLRIDGDYVIHQLLQDPATSEHDWETVYRLAPLDVRQRTGLEAWIAQHPSLSHLKGMRGFVLLDERKLSQLRKTVSDVDAPVHERGDAIQQLGNVGDTDAIELLEPLVMEPTALTTRAAVALANIGGAAASGVLVKALLSERIVSEPWAMERMASALALGHGGALEPAARDQLLAWVTHHWRANPPAMPHVLFALIYARLPMGGGLVLDMLKHEALDPALRSSVILLLGGVIEEPILEAAGAYALRAHDEELRAMVIEALPFVPPDGEVARTLSAQIHAPPRADDMRLVALALLAKTRARFPNSPLLRSLPSLVAANLRAAYEEGVIGAADVLWRIAARCSTEELNALAWEVAARPLKFPPGHSTLNDALAAWRHDAPLQYLRTSRAPLRAEDISRGMEQLLKNPRISHVSQSEVVRLLGAKAPALLPWFLKRRAAHTWLHDALVDEALEEAAKNGWLVFPEHVVDPSGRVEYPPAQ